MAFDFHPVSKKVIPNVSRENVLLEIMNFADESGWDIVYSDFVSTRPYIVLRSGGYNMATYEWPLYLCFRYIGAGLARVLYFFYFDTTTNTPYSQRGYVDMSSTYTGYWYRQGTYFGTTNNLTLYANKDLLYLCNHVSEKNHTYGVYTVKINDLIYNMTSKSVSDVPEGYDVTIDLNTGATSKYLVGDKYIMVNTDGSANQISINNIDYLNDRITVDRIHATTTSGALIGSINNIIPWATMLAGENDNAVMLKYTNNDIYNSPGSDYSFANSEFLHSYYFGYIGHAKSDYAYGKREVLNRPFIRSTSYDDNVGFCDYIRYNENVAPDKTFGYNKLYTGTCTVSGTTNTLTDSSKNWDIDELSDRCLIILDGQNTGDIKYILSNDNNTITISGTFTNPMPLDSIYSVFEEGYTSIYPTTNTASHFRHLLRIV